MKVQEKRGKILYLLGFLISIYFFIFAIMLMKFGFSDLSESALNLTRNNISPLNAVVLVGFDTNNSIKWSICLAIIAFNTSGIIGASLLIFLILGTRIGNTITSFFVSMCLSAKRRDFRHGFEIGLANLIYAIPIFCFDVFIRIFF
jgi:Na+/phosphate symporter